MNEKMHRFLSSIGIENPERFDIDFDYVSRNQFNRAQVDMMIVKDVPWTYVQLEELMHAFESIGYPYTVKFSYKKKPTPYDVIALFEDWFRTHNRFNPNFFLEVNGEFVRFVYPNEDVKNSSEYIEKDFKEFLNFIGYYFNMDSIVNEEVKKPEYSEEEIEEITNKAQEVASNDIEESSNDSNTVYQSEEEREEATKEEVKQYEEANADDLLANLKRMEKERKAAQAKRKQSYENYKSFQRGSGGDSWRDKLPFQVIEDFNDIKEDSGNIDIDGEIFGIDKPKTIKGGKTLLVFGIGKKGIGIGLKAIENEHMSGDLLQSLKNGMYARVKGYAEQDKFTHQLNVNVRMLELIPPPALRTDDAPVKRVELHLHSKMSVMDGVTSIKDYVALAKNMGHKAIALTDHGVVQAYPEAQAAAKAADIKMIYGCELYMVNDELPFALNPKDIELSHARYVVFDLETTGLSTRYDRITEFGAVVFEGGQITQQIDFFVNPEIPIPEKVQKKTRITDEMVKDAPKIEDAIDRILEVFQDSIIVSHNITFDVGFINEALRRLNREPLANPAIDTLSLSRYMFPENNIHRLGTLARNLGIMTYNEDEAHRADFDAKVLNEVWLAMLNKLLKDNFNLKHSDLANIKVNETMLKHLRSDHIVALCKDKQGLHDLYELISLSHITYLADVPKTPKREIALRREHLLLGTACFNGEIFDIARTRSKEDLINAMKFYDYVEVQPPANYSHLIHIGAVDNVEEIERYIKDIIEAADELGKPVVATGDVHYKDPDDKITRDVYISALAVGGKPHPLSRNKVGPAPDQHFRSTQEMLDAFSFLGEEKAYEIVVTNTNKIADLVENLSPIQKTLHPPVIEGSPEILRETVYKNAHELYGDPLPEFIEQRLEKELNGIIGNGYSVTYYIANRIVSKAHEDGYMVGSRGSVGSSLAATMFGITEVNPLPPHYRCPHCKHFEFSKDKDVLSGFDLPDRNCPECGTRMVADGQNIPFETFLGFNGDKIPDIDLNFPSDYQQRAFDYTKVVFGEHNVFRAGTVETVAEKTAFGYVRGYYESKGIDPSTIPSQNIAYLASHLVDVKRTTGQHPGGIMVLPKGLSIYDFTPIQYPADNKDSSWYTTHFDYTALHDALLKLDLLGHVDPLALRLMQEMAHLDVKDIPLNDTKVISLFTSDKALNRKGNYLHARTGALGLPEFGTDTSQDTLCDAQPKSFADLVIISGLSHGTDVWNNNARDLILNGTCTIREVIGCRDDIMTYLIKKGLPSDISFKIMEDVRKGRKVKPEYEELMRANNVPQWYIDSCNKIKYMFPKGHAVAYVTMAVRVGYFKLYYPLVFYAVWFTARCKQYDIKAMLGGLDGLTRRYEEIKRKKNTKGEKVLPKEKDIFKMLEVAIEMEERGFTFANVDLYKSKATEFVVDEEHKALIPPFIVIDGLGESAAESVIEARKDGEFTSIENLSKRTKLSGTNINDLKEIGALNDLGETEQMSLFEFGLGL